MRKVSLWGTVRTIKDRDVLKSHLEKGLNDSVPEMQVSALKYLHAYANKMPDMFPQVLALTKHDAPRVRMAAVDALVPFKAKSSECLEALNYISEHDSDPEVRAGTYYAFARMDLEFASKAESLLERISRKEEDTKLRNSAKLALMSLRRRLARDRGAMIPGEELGR
jgi:HEAT repeat protein